MRLAESLSGRRLNTQCSKGAAGHGLPRRDPAHSVAVAPRCGAKLRNRWGPPMNPTRIFRGLAMALAVGVITVLLGWAFAAYRDPDRVGDFASFVALCVTVLRP